MERGKTTPSRSTETTETIGVAPEKTYLDERIPWTAWDGLLNMGILPVFFLAAAFWAHRTRNLGAFVGFGGGGTMLVATAFIKYGDLAWGGLIANVFATGAIFGALGAVVSLFGSCLSSLIGRRGGE